MTFDAAVITFKAALAADDEAVAKHDAAVAALPGGEALAIAVANLPASPLVDAVRAIVAQLRQQIADTGKAMDQTGYDLLVARDQLLVATTAAVRPVTADSGGPGQI